MSSGGGNQNVLAIWICFYKQKLRRAIKSNNANLLWSILYQHNIDGNCPFKRLARAACGMEMESGDSYTEKFYRHRLHHGVSCDCTDCDLDHLCLEQQTLTKHLDEMNLKIHDGLCNGLPIEKWAPICTASAVLEARGISASNTPFMANAIKNNTPQFNDQPENWWEMDEKFLFPQPTQYYTPIDFFCPCLLQCTCPMELSIFSSRSAYDDMPTPSFPPLVCPLILGLTSRNQDIASLFLSRLFTKVQPNILPPLIKTDKEGNQLPPENRDVKEPRTLRDYDKEYVTGKMLTLLTLPCRGYASILVYNYPTQQWKQQLREKLKLPEPEQEDQENFMALLYNYYDMPTGLLLRNKRLSLLSPAQFLNFCGLDVARKLLNQPITLFGAKVNILDSANRRLELYSTKKYVDLSDYENKIKLATRHAICYGPKPEGTLANPPGDSDEDEDEDEDEDFDPTKEDEKEQPPAIPYMKIETVDEEKEHLIDPDVLDTSGPSLENKYWRELTKTAPPKLQPLYQILACVVADDWTKLADIYEEYAKDIGAIHFTLLSLLKKGEDLLFSYSSMAKCNTYQLPTFEKLRGEKPETYSDEQEINDELIVHYGAHIMGHFRAIVIGLATGALSFGTQDEKLPLETVLEFIFSPLYVGDVIFSSTTTMYWKGAIHMNPDYDLTLSQKLTPFTGMNIRGLTSDANEYVILALRHDNVRFFTALLYLIIEINGLPARFLAEFGRDNPELAKDPRGAMAMVCEFVPDLRGLLSSTSLLIMALNYHAPLCVTAIVHTFPIWCWQQLSTWAYTGFSPSHCMRLARSMSEGIPPVLSSFDENTIRKLTPIFGRYINLLLENQFDPQLLEGDGEALGIVYGVYDKYTQSRKGYFTRGNGFNGLTTEYNEADIHTHRSLIRDLRWVIDKDHVCPFCQAGHCDAGFDHGLELNPDFIFRLPTGLIDIAVIMGHTSVASALLLLSMALRSQFSLTETFRLFSKEVILPEDEREILADDEDEDEEPDNEDLKTTTTFTKLTPANSRCICHAKSVDDLHSILPKRFYPYLMIRFLCSPLLVPSFEPELRNSMLYVHPFISAAALDNQDLLHLFNTAGFDTLTTTEVHNYAVDPCVASVGAPTTIMLRTMFTLIRQRFKRLIMILFNCARSVTSSILCTDELVFTSALANPLPVITHAYTKFPYEMFQVKPQENAKTLPLSSRLLLFSHSNVIDYMLYKVVAAAANGILTSYKAPSEYLLVDNYIVTPLSRREDVAFPGDDDEDGPTNPDAPEEEDDEELRMERIEWYAEQKRIKDAESEELQPDPLKRETTTPSLAMVLRTTSPWILYALLRCLHPAYDAHGTMNHINENIITPPEVTIYSNSPFVFNDNAGIGSCASEPDDVVDDQIGTRNRDLLNAVATINKLTAAVQLHAKATGDRLGTQWSLLYNRFPIGMEVHPNYLNDEVPLEEYDPTLSEEADSREEVFHLNKEAMDEILEGERQKEKDRQSDLFGEASQEDEMKRNLDTERRILDALKFDRYESRQAQPQRRSPYFSKPTASLDVDDIKDTEGTALSAYLTRGMLSTMPSRKYDEIKDKEGNVIPVQTVLLCAMLHTLNSKVYGVPSGEDGKIMTVPMSALAPRCNNIPALRNILDRGDKVLFDVFQGYGSVISVEEQKQASAQQKTMPGHEGHEPQALRDALDELIQDDPEWGQYVNQNIDHVTEVLSTSLTTALKQFQQAMGIPDLGLDDDDIDIFT